MKKLLLSLFILLGTGFCSNSFGQIQNIEPNIPSVSRIVHFYIYGLETQNQIQVLKQALEKEEDKIHNAQFNLSTQMCTLSVSKVENNDIMELMYIAGFKGIYCESLPPSGQRYVFNPDGTWKIKDL